MVLNNCFCGCKVKAGLLLLVVLTCKSHWLDGLQITLTVITAADFTEISVTNVVVNDEVCVCVCVCVCVRARAHMHICTH